MTYRCGGFVDNHAHLLGVVSRGQSALGSLPVRELHEACAIEATTPMDVLVGPVELEGLEERLRSGLELARSVGLVKVTETGVMNWAIYDALRSLRERDELAIHVELFAASGLVTEKMPERTGDTMLELSGVKFYADGWLGPRTCAVSVPFLDEPSNSGILFLDKDRLAARIAPLAEKGFRIATHAIGDRGIDAALDAYEAVYGADCRAAAPRIEHAQLLRPDHVARLSEMGVVVCIQPGFAHDDLEAVRRALGTRFPYAYRWSALSSAGVQLISGSDYPVDSLSPLSGLEKLLSNPFDTLSASDALSLMTDDRLGTVGLSDDPTNPGTNLLTTVVEQVSVKS